MLGFGQFHCALEVRKRFRFRRYRLPDTMPEANQPSTMRHAADPLFLEIFWTRVRSIADEAAKLIVRTSFSTLSTEANDFAVVITNSSGHAIAVNSGSVPSFIGTLPR